MPTLQTDAQFDGPEGIDEVKTFEEFKPFFKRYMDDYSYRHNKQKKDYEGTNLEATITQIATAVAASSGGGGGSGKDTRVIDAFALAAGDNDVPFDTPFADASYIPLILVYWEDPPGQKNPMTGWYLKSFDRYKLVIHSDEALELWAIAIHS